MGTKNIVKRRSILERFWEKVKVGSLDECWPWIASLHGDGYGQFNTGRRIINAHIFAYDVQTGTEIPAGLHHDHLCRNPTCMNARHLEGVTQATNNLRGIGAPAVHARKTHCIHGHPFHGTNLYLDGPRRAHRNCLTCKRRRGREYQLRKRLDSKKRSA